MSKSIANNQMPILGRPIWVIDEQDLEKRVQLTGEHGYLNSLTYFAANAILVMKLGYDERDPGNLDKIVINEGMKHPDDNTKSLEIRMDLSKNFSGEANSRTIFVDEELVQAVAKKLNQNQKAKCKKFVDIINKGLNEYDAIIDACKVV